MMVDKQWRISTLLFLATLTGFPAACAPAEADTPLPPAAIHTFTPLTTARATATVTVRPSDTPEYSMPTPVEPTAAPASSAADYPILLPGWQPQGAIARIGLGFINHVRFGPDGQSLLVGGKAGLFLFDAELKNRIWTVPTAKPVERIAFSADGGMIAAAVQCANEWVAPTAGGNTPPCVDHTEILVFRASDGGLAARIDLGTGEDAAQMIDMALSDDGREAIAAELAVGFAVYDTATGRLLRMYPDPAMDFGTVAFSPDGGWAAVAHYSPEEIRIINLRTGETDQTLAVSFDSNAILALSRDGRRLAKAVEDTIDVWNVADGDPLAEVEGSGAWFSCLAFSPDGDRIAAGESGGKIFEWSVADGKQILEYPVGGRWIKAIDFSPDGGQILGAIDADLEIRDSRTGKLRSEIRGEFSQWEAARFTADGRELLLEGYDFLDALDAGTLAKKAEYAFPGGAQLSPDFRMYAVQDSDGIIRFYDTGTGSIRYAWKGPDYLRGMINAGTFALSFDHGSAFTVDQESGVIDSWEVRDGAHKLQFPAPQANNAVYTSPDGTRVAIHGTTYDLPGELAIYSALDGQWIQTFMDNYELPIGWSEDLSRVVTVCEAEGMHDRLCLYDGTGGIALESYPTDLGANRMNAVWVSPDGTEIAAGTVMGPLLIWDAASGRNLATLVGHTMSVFYLSFSPDGKTLASTSADGTVVIWRAPNYP
jgi:WD40 repeat protein